MLASMTTTRNRPSRPGFSRSRNGGWNLIELLVVISIIVILLGIIINTASEKAGPEQQTRVIVRAAMAIATEYEVQTQAKIPHATDPAGYTGVKTSMARFIYLAKQNATTYKMLRSLGKDAVGDNTIITTIKDAWGEELRYVNGKNKNDTHTEDDNMPNWPTPYFASAGADGKWGIVDDAGKPNADAEDNIYSFNLD